MDREVVGAIAGIYADGDFIALTSTGVLDVDGPAPLTTGSPMRIGSLTKTFTAALVVALAEQGVLALTDPVSLLLPDAPAGLTIEQLLSHESPFRDGDVSGQLLQAVADPTSIETPEDATARLLGGSFSAAPNAHQAYASVNYVVVDQVVAAAVGQPYEDVLRTEILEPIGLSSTGFVPVDELPSPHERLDPSQPPLSLATFETDAAVRASGAAGALISTAADLGAFFEALFTGEVITKDSLQAMLDVSSSTRTDYGLGIGVYSAGGKTLFGHNGRTIGFASSVRHDPDRRQTVIVLSNDGGAPTSELAQKLSVTEAC